MEGQIGWSRWWFIVRKQGYCSADVLAMRHKQAQAEREQAQHYKDAIAQKAQRAKDERRLAELLAHFGAK